MSLGSHGYTSSSLEDKEKDKEGKRHKRSHYRQEAVCINHLCF